MTHPEYLKPNWFEHVFSRLYALFICFFAFSCAGIFDESSPQTNLVERSKADPPSWTQ